MILSEPLSPSMKLRYVIDLEEGLITQHSHEIGYLNNGVECYFVFCFLIETIMSSSS